MDADAFRVLPDAACGNDVRGRRAWCARARSRSFSGWLALDGAAALVTGAVAFGALDWWSTQFGVDAAVLAGASLASLPYALGIAALAANDTACPRRQSLAVASKVAAVLVAWFCVLMGDGPTVAGTVALALWTAAALAVAAGEWRASVRSAWATRDAGACLAAAVARWPVSRAAGAAPCDQRPR